MAHSKIIERFFENHHRQWERRVHDSLWAAFKKDVRPSHGRETSRDEDAPVPRPLAGRVKSKK